MSRSGDPHDAVCQCGHTRDDHRECHRECLVDDCDCIAYEEDPE